MVFHQGMIACIKKKKSTENVQVLVLIMLSSVEYEYIKIGDASDRSEQPGSRMVWFLSCTTYSHFFK